MQGIVKMVSNWNLKYLIKLFVIAGIIFALVSGYLGYTRLYLTDERAFWLAIDNSLSTPSVTRTLVSGGTGNQVLQKQQIFFGVEPKVVSQVTFDQVGATENTSVITEGVSFLDSQYSRYTKFTTSQTREDGTEVNIDHLLDKWSAFENSTGDDFEQSRLNYLAELVTLVIFGNFDAEYKRNLVSQLQQQGVYEVNFDEVVEDTIEDESVRLYNVSVNLKVFAEIMTETFKEAGYGEFPPLNPENYQADAQISALFAVSKRTGAIVGIDYGSRREQYSGHGISKTIERPQAEFESGELEQLVQEAIGAAL